MTRTVAIDADRGWLRQRIVETDTVDKRAVTGGAYVRDDDTIAGLFLGASTAKPHTKQGRSLLKTTQITTVDDCGDN
jgi:hypothetical protein